MLDEREALVAAIAANPDDDTPRLVFADWLQEHDEEDRAEFIRLQCEARQLAPPETRRWPNPDPRFAEVSDLAWELFELRQQFWLEPFCRALGAEEIPPPEPPRSLVTRVIRRFRPEPRFTRYSTDYFGGDSATLDAWGNGPVWRIHFDRGFVNSLDITFGSNHLVRDISAAFSIEPVTRLAVTFGPNRAHWRALDRPCLGQIKFLGLQMPREQDLETSAALASLTASENWSGLDELMFWSPTSDGLRLSGAYLAELVRSPLLLQVRGLRLATDFSGLSLLARSPQAAGLRSLNAWGCYLPVETGAVLAGAGFQGTLEQLDVSGNELGDEGVRGLVSGKWPRLQSLHVGFNHIGDDGVRHLLPLVPQLRELGLSGGAISDAGAYALADAIDPARLVWLCLSYNPLSEHIVRVLRGRFGERFQFTTREEDEQRHRGVP